MHAPELVYIPPLLLKGKKTYFLLEINVDIYVTANSCMFILSSITQFQTGFIKIIDVSTYYSHKSIITFRSTINVACIDRGIDIIAGLYFLVHACSVLYLLCVYIYI